MDGKCNHTRDEEQEDREKFQICAEDCTAAGLFFIFTRKDALDDELVSTPVPETDYSRADKGSEPSLLFVIVVTDEVDHSVAIFVDLNTGANFHHFIPSAKFFESEDKDDERAKKKNRGLEHGSVKH